MSDLRPGRRDEAATALITTVGFVALLWALEIIDTLADHRLDQFGIQPRSQEGLVGILAAPLLHGGFGHLLANTLPALVLGFLVLVTGIGRGLVATAIIWIVGGVGVWLTSPDNSITLGASGVIFGWLAFLLARGIVTRRARDLGLGLLVLVLYGGLLLGVLPGTPGVSWQGHLFGALGGLLAVWVTEERHRRTPAVDRHRI